MTTVVMKWLETTPRNYDRGIQLLTLGRLQPLKERIARDYLFSKEQFEPCVLEIGCGTGTLAILMARQGVRVSAVDASEIMLDEARHKAAEARLADAIKFLHMDVSELSDYFEPGSFDVVASTLTFSEFPPEVRRYALDEILQLLKPGGRLLIADEVIPFDAWRRFVYWAIRLPLAIFTWLLTRTSTSPLSDFPDSLAEAGFTSTVVESHLGGSLQLFVAQPAEAIEPTGEALFTFPQLHHRLTPKTLFLDLLSLVNRLIPPYPKKATGLYRIGSPDRRSPVLVTGNYELTVRRLVKALDSRLNCWLLVANSRGINVWCAAGGGHFTAEDVISGLKTSGVMDVVDHHALILPQLCANGVDGWKIRQETHWGVFWGPARAEDIPAYLVTGRKKTDAMRHVHFGFKSRLEMTTVTYFFYGFLLLIPFLLFWRQHIFLLLGLTALIAYFYGLFLPWIPGRDGLAKGAVLALLTVLSLWVVSTTWLGLSPESLFNWSLGLGFLAFFIGAEFQGMSPLMRGEQANWSVELPIGLATLVIYVASRLLFGI